MIAAQSEGTVTLAGYMEVYDPAFELAPRAVGEICEIRFVQVNHLHPNNNLHLRRFADYPAAAIEQTTTARKIAVRQALSDAHRRVVRAFNLLSGSMIHDLVRSIGDAVAINEAGRSFTSGQATNPTTFTLVLFLFSFPIVCHVPR